MIKPNEQMGLLLIGPFGDLVICSNDQITKRPIKRSAVCSFGLVSKPNKGFQRMLFGGIWF
jgi:hypothetical protein